MKRKNEEQTEQEQPEGGNEVFSRYKRVWVFNWRLYRENRTNPS